MIASILGAIFAFQEQTEHSLREIEIAGIEIETLKIVIGLAKGLAYAALAAGFILIYRSTGVLNFAHAETGALGLAIFVYLLVEQDLNWWLAYVIAIFVGAMAGMIVELVIVRRLFNSPRLVLLIATIGVAQLLQAIKINLPSVTQGGNIPLPFEREFGNRRTDIMVLRPRVYVVLLVVPVIILLLGLFLSRTRFGLAVRATASNADTARVYGTSPRITSTIVWTIAGALAVSTAVLVAPLENTSAAQAGTAALAAPLLLRAIVVGLLARMRSLPKAMMWGMVVGVIEQIVQDNVDSSNRAIVDLYLFLAVLVVTLVITRGNRKEEEASWSLSPHLTPVPERIRNIWWIKYLNHMGFAIVFGGFAIFGLLVDSPSKLVTWSGILIFAIIGVSLSLLTGWAGQLSLGHFAFVGLGALCMVMLTQGNEIPLLGTGFELEWGLAMVLSVAIGVVAATLIGLPALRVKGLFLAVVTLAFAVASTNWLFQQDFLIGSGTATEEVVEPVIGPVDFAGRKAFYWLCLGSLMVACWMLARIRKTGIGRSLIAVRENEDAAAANTVSPSRMKLIGFAVAGGMAAYAGALFITFRGAIVPASTFTPEASLRVVAIAIIGGLGSIAGPVLGTLWVQGVPALWGTNPPDLVVLLTSSIGLLLLLMYFPGGIQQLVYKLRDQIVYLADQRYGPGQPVPERPVVKAVPTRNRGPIELPEGQPALQTEGVSVRFGGNRAVNEVSFNVMPGELVGLIGTNGAGKSTLLNAISGFVPSTGRIEVLGREVNNLSAHQRHRLGLGRGFQAAKLYPDLNVRETLMVALEARESSKLVPSILAVPPSPASEARKQKEADEIIHFLGLGAFADSYIGSLSTGTRRIVELGSLLAVDAQVLLLDEPTGGVAQKETEAFGPLIRSIQQELEAAVVVIEHDMPLVMSISDRVYCLEAGEVIAEGLPDDVRNDPLVISSYLGTDERAIARSEQA
ncbi:MAG: ATP-binding cassette domain-containing protein [Acidimicrobiales bacterium]|nr:ATP-binding cassette domain-containing protein [Acidimicrobiales bacterium]